MTFKSYLESGGEQCPKCGSRAVKASGKPKKRKGTQVEVPMFCAKCGTRWRDIYTLSQAEEL